MEVEIQDNKLELIIVVNKFPLVDNIDLEPYFRLCSDIAGKSEKFVARRRCPKNRT